jgi:cyclase
MQSPRIIARLDVKGPNVIKGIHLEGLRIVGNPGDLARKYYQQGIDELLYMDTVASLYDRNNILPIVEATARDVFVPMTVGGGIRSVEDIVSALRSGADKVAINTAAVANPEFIEIAAQMFGSQCIVISIEAKERERGRWEVLTENGREGTGRDVSEWAAEVQQRGAGEILITSVDREGTKKGFDDDLFKMVRSCVEIPVIGAGGAGSAAHVTQTLSRNDIDAVACAGLFHYDICSVRDLKIAIASAGMKVRPEAA